MITGLFVHDLVMKEFGGAPCRYSGQWFLNISGLIWGSAGVIWSGDVETHTTPDPLR
jgi:hypothetical protein